MRPRKKRLKIPISFIRLLGQSLAHGLAVIYAVGRNLASYLHNRSRKNIGLLGQSLTKRAIIYAVAIWLVICIIIRPAKKRF